MAYQLQLVADSGPPAVVRDSCILLLDPDELRLLAHLVLIDLFDVVETNHLLVLEVVGFSCGLFQELLNRQFIHRW